MIKNNILALDASTEALSLALHYQGELYVHFEECPQQHSQKILPLIDELLNKAQCTLSDLDVIGFGQGPGSFTGVRISVAIAQGLAYASKLPLVGVSTLNMLASQAQQQTQCTEVFSAIDARMGEIYFAHYKVNQHGFMALVSNEQVIKPELLTLPNVTATAVGTGWQTYPGKVTTISGVTHEQNITLPDAQFMMATVQEAFDKGDTVDAANAQPKYVRDTVTWKKLPGKE